MQVLRARSGADPLFVALLAFCIRLLHAWFVSRTPFFEGPVIDSYTYRLFAENLANTGDFGGAFYQPPLYPVFLAILFRVGLGSAWAVAVVQSALGSATVALLVFAGRRLATREHDARRVGLAVGIAAALYGPSVFFDIELLPPCIVDVLLAGALVLSLRPARFGVVDAALGLMLGLAVIGWSLSIILGAGLLALRARRLPSNRRAPGVLLALLLALPPAALTAHHNATHDGKGVIVSFNSGINLWLGNNPEWRETWRARPGARFEPEFERPDREGVTRPGDRSAYFVRLVVRDAARRPFAALGRTVEKFYYVWHGREIRRNQDIDLMREASPVLHVLSWEAGLFFPFGVVAPLALLGFWRRRREPDVLILACSVMLYAVVLAAFFVASRYRLPVALFLLPLAVDEVFYLLTKRPDPTTGVMLAGLTLFLNFPNDFTKSFAAGAAERGILEAHAWRNQGKTDRADRISADLVERFAADANVQMLRAEVLDAAGRCSESVHHLKRVIELAPRAATPRVMLGTCFEQLGDPAAAERAFATALSLHPYHPIALKRTGALYARHGRVLEAQAVLRRFVASGYDDPEVNRWLKELAGPAGRARAEH